MCMGKVTNVVLGLLNIRFYLLIVILALASCQTVSAADHLVATCDGPGGYCSEGSNVTIKYVSGGEVTLPPIPDAGKYGSPEIRLGYCPQSGGMAASGCRYLNKMSISKQKLQQGGWSWNDYTGVFTGYFKIPEITTKSRQSDYCVAAWISSFSEYTTSGAIWLSFGENVKYNNLTTPCVGYTPPPPPPELCYINSGNPISVDFGQIERSGIGVSRDGTSGVSRSVSVNCLGTHSHLLRVQLNMTPTGWSDSQIATSNPALGVALSYDGKPMKNGDHFDMTVQGSATQSLGFVLLRDPGKATTAIATGAFHASATLIVSEP